MLTFMRKKMVQRILWLLPFCFIYTAPHSMAPSFLQDIAIAGEEKPIPPETERNLKFARKYRAERRYELARQHYLMALATCNTTGMRDAIQRDLEEIELQIRTLR